MSATTTPPATLALAALSLEFRALAEHKLEGMEPLLVVFNQIILQFRAKGHDLLDYHSNKVLQYYESPRTPKPQPVHKTTTPRSTGEPPAIDGRTEGT